MKLIFFFLMKAVICLFDSANNFNFYLQFFEIIISNISKNISLIYDSNIAGILNKN